MEGSSVANPDLLLTSGDGFFSRHDPTWFPKWKMPSCSGAPPFKECEEPIFCQWHPVPSSDAPLRNKITLTTSPPPPVGYWPSTDNDVVMAAKSCASCTECLQIFRVSRSCLVNRLYSRFNSSLPIWVQSGVATFLLWPTSSASGPKYTFCRDWDISHAHSSPHHDIRGKVHSRAIPGSWKKRRVFSKGFQDSPSGSLG